MPARYSPGGGVRWVGWAGAWLCRGAGGRVPGVIACCPGVPRSAGVSLERGIGLSKKDKNIYQTNVNMSNENIIMMIPANDPKQ